MFGGTDGPFADVGMKVPSVGSLATARLPLNTSDGLRFTAIPACRHIPERLRALRAHRREWIESNYSNDRKRFWTGTLDEREREGVVGSGGRDHESRALVGDSLGILKFMAEGVTLCYRVVTAAVKHNTFRAREAMALFRAIANWPTDVVLRNLVPRSPLTELEKLTCGPRGDLKTIHFSHLTDPWRSDV
ncbi:hypothetical protein P691DRAFT_781487 [Macrolepiota fuliginosa MF-IS2]|uniref:Uncharacterized protein n=1 Tax=Macrolepiota fuliginosa MF-IS2 TaxID=1400762 RepID=A0A9P5XCD2_9AGAR|nr:hypothetical protein P691DRAFT_781487 [Macrolepiota fuliginosa MF-IS2]